MCGLDSAISELGPVAGACKHGNALLDSMEGR